MTDQQAKRIGLHRAKRMTPVIDRRQHGPDDHSDAVIAAAIMAAMNQPDTLENAIRPIVEISREDIERAFERAIAAWRGPEFSNVLPDDADGHKRPEAPSLISHH